MSTNDEVKTARVERLIRAMTGFCVAMEHASAAMADACQGLTDADFTPEQRARVEALMERVDKVTEGR